EGYPTAKEGYPVVYVPKEPRTTATSAADPQPRTVTAYLDALSNELDRLDKLIEEVKQTVSPIISNAPQDNKKADALQGPESIASPVVATLRQLLRRVEGQCIRLCYIRDAVEL